jgi:hypothetical protein
MKTVFASVLLLALAACASGPHQVAPIPKLDVEVSSDAVSRILVLLPPEAAAQFPLATVRDDQELVGVIGGGHFLAWERPATEVVVAIDVEDKDGETTHLSVAVPCEAGTAYYYAIRVDPAWDRPRLRRLESGPARKIMAGLTTPP